MRVALRYKGAFSTDGDGNQLEFNDVSVLPGSSRLRPVTYFAVSNTNFAFEKVHTEGISFSACRARVLAATNTV